MRPYEDSFPLNRFIPSLRRLRVPAVQRCYQSRKVILLPSLDKEPLIAPRHLVRTHSVFYSETADSITAFCLFEDRALVAHTLYPRGFQVLEFISLQKISHTEHACNCLSHTPATPTYASHIASLVLKRRYILFSRFYERKWSFFDI